MKFGYEDGKVLKALSISPNWKTFENKVKSIIGYRSKVGEKGSDDGQHFFLMMSITEDEETVVGDLFHGSRAKLLSTLMGFNRMAPIEEVPEEKYAINLMLPDTPSNASAKLLIQPAIDEYYVYDVVAQWMTTLAKYDEAKQYQAQADAHLRTILLSLQSLIVKNRTAKELNI